MKKNKVAFSLTVVLVLLVIAGMQTLSAMDLIQSFQQADQRTERMSKEPLRSRSVLVVYYSHSGHIPEAAQEIQAQTGGDLLELETLEPYPEEYNARSQQSKQKLTNAERPALKTTCLNVAAYDVIFVGSPFWQGATAPPVASFLAANDLAGKLVAPFVAHAGSGLVQSTESLQKLTPSAQVLSGLALEEPTANETKEKIAEWLSQLQVVE